MNYPKFVQHKNKLYLRFILFGDLEICYLFLIETKILLLELYCILFPIVTLWNITKIFLINCTIIVFTYTIYCTRLSEYSEIIEHQIWDCLIIAEKWIQLNLNLDNCNTTYLKSNIAKRLTDFWFETLILKISPRYRISNQKNIY